MLSSILHRASGVFVSFGLVILAIWLACAATGKADYSAPGFFASLFWFVWTAALYYHFCNGIRHLVWDAGKGFEVKCAEKSAKMVFIATAVLTVLTWLVVLVN